MEGVLLLDCESYSLRCEPYVKVKDGESYLQERNEEKDEGL